VIPNKRAYLVFIPTMLLLVLGLVMVFSAGSVYGLNQSGYRYFVQQAGWAALGFGLMILLRWIDYHKLRLASYVGVVISIGLLVAVLIWGQSVGGAKRWLIIGPLRLQPTEIAKFTAVVCAACVLAMKGDKVKRLGHLLVPVLALAVVEAGLIILQPDLGSSVILLLSLFVVITVSQSRPRHLALIAASGAAIGLVAAVSVPYRFRRLLSFINPWKDPRGYGYHVIQSYIALGSGRIKGVGLGMSRQKFLYLPNAHNDFIFAIIGEELGLIGTLVVVLLVGLLAFGGLRVARGAPDELGKLLAVGITALIVIQALVNMGGVTGLLPITGVPLPLVSFGGSSLCICMACIGILLNIAAQSR
jgi:cell division protein FtsW